MNIFEAGRFFRRRILPTGLAALALATVGSFGPGAGAQPAPQPETESRALAVQPENLSVGAPLVLLPGTPPPDSMVCDDVMFDALPADFTAGALGNAGQVAAASVNGRLHLSGTGSELYHGQDNAAFFWREVSGDFRLQIDIEALPVQTSSGNRKIGLMLRDSTHAQAARVMIEYLPAFPGGPALQFDVRTQQGATPVELASTQVNIQLPVTVALVRRGSRVTVLFSADGGTSWVQPLGGKQGSIDLTMADPLLVGANVASYDQQNPITGAFDDLRLCRPAPVPPPPPPACPEQPLDLMLLVDVSGSMKRQHGVAGNSRLDSVRDALLQIVQAVEARGDGSRAAMVLYSGTGVPANNLANGARLRTAFGAGIPALRTAIQQLDDAPIGVQASSPAAIALAKVLQTLNEQRDPSHRAVLLWATDNLGNVDLGGRATSHYTDAELQQISVVDGAGGFLGAEQVLFQGNFNPTIFTYDGQPVADSMHALSRLLAAHPLPVVALVPRGDGSPEQPILREDLILWAARQSGGGVFGSSDRQGLLALAAPLLASLDCTLELPPPPPGVSIDTPALGQGCLAAGAPFAAGGVFAVPSPAAATPLALQATPAGGSPAGYAGAISADGGRWSVSGILPGNVDGLVQLDVVATDSLGRSARALAALRVDAGAPTLTLTESGAPLAGQGEGPAPPAGAAAVLFGRPVAIVAQVADGPGAAPPQAGLTVDGVPYAAGSLISAPGRHVVVARVTDCAGREVVRHALIEIDRTAPALLSTNPADQAGLQQGPGSYAGTADADLAKATINGRAAAITGSGAFALAPFPWREGENVVDLVLEDRAGNRASYRRRFTVQSLPLSVEIRESGLPIQANQLFARPVAPRATASSSGASVVLSLNGGPFQNGSSISASGSYTLVATATEGPRTATASATFRLDLQPAPTVEILSPLDGSRASGATIEVSGTYSGDGATVTVNGLPATLSGNGFVRAAVPLHDQEIVQLEAVVTDRLGRRASHSVGVLRSDGMTLLILDPVAGATTNRDRIDLQGVVVGGRAETLDGKAVVGNGGVGGPVGQPVVVDLAPDGSFRARDIGLQIGSNELYAEVKDRFGAPRRATVVVRADFRPPQIALAANGQPLVEGAFFARDVDLLVTLTDDSGQLAETVLRLNGQPQTATGSPISLRVEADGGYLLGVSARDAAGNEARAERSFVIDRGGCALSEIEPAAGSSVDQAAVSLRGKSGDAVAVEVLVAGQAAPHQALVADGTFLLAGLQLPQVGLNNLQIRCRDAGGESQTIDHPLTLLPASGGPLVEIVSPLDGAVLNVASVDVDGTSSVPTVSVNGAAVGVVGGNLWSKPALPLAVGPNIVVARAVDGAGRVATDRVVLHRDAAPPKISISAPDNGARLGIPGGGTASVDVTGLIDLAGEPHLASVAVSAGGATVTASVDAAGRFVALAVPLDAGLPADQAQTITATATDSLGHQASATVEVYLDPAGPLIRLEAPADLAFYRGGAAGPVEVRGSAWAIDGARVTINGGQLDPATLSWQAPAADGRRRVDFTTSVPLPDRDGSFGIQARVIDPQDRTAQDRRLLFRDTKAPLAVELIPADGTVGVDPDSLLFALFDEPVKASTLGGEGGLRLVRSGTGEPVAGSYTVAGSAVGFAPAASLVRGEQYSWSAGLGIEDVAGNQLGAAKNAVFRVGQLASATAPGLDPLESLICADRLEIKGQASPGATVKVRDGSLILSTFADQTGRFRLELPIASNGYHLLHVFAVDADSGIASPETTVAVQVDCSAPQVRDASFDRTAGAISIRFSENVDAATLAVGGAGAAINLADAEDPAAPPQTAQLALSGALLSLQLDAGQLAWWRDRPVRLTVGPPAADLEGNPMGSRFETVFFPGSSSGLAGGFLFGETYDDTTGRPLYGVSAGLYAASQPLPGSVDPAGAGAPQVQVVSEGRGRYTMAGEVPSGRYSVLLEKAGYTRVLRRLSLEPAKGAVPFDSRLTPLAAAGEPLDPAAGGRADGGVEEGAYAFEAAAGVLPGAAPLSPRLTPLSAQGLPDFLPLGYTPAAAVDLRLEAAGVALPEDQLFLAGAALELPLPAWVEAADPLVAVQYELATGRWLVLAPPQRSGALAIVSPRGPGVVAVVLADADERVAPPAAVVGEALLGSEAPEDLPGFTATLSLDPPVVPPTGRSLARVVARSADQETPWPSGLAVQAFLEERLVLAAGLGQELEAPFAADLLLYHPRLSAAELAGAAPAAAGELRFVVSPSPRAAQVLLDVGWENIRIYPFPEETQRGQVVGPAGGSVGDPQAAELTIPEGALSSDTVATVELLDADELAALPAVQGYASLAAVRISFQGRTLGRPATLRLAAPAGAPAEVAGDPRLILAELIEEPGDYRGSLFRLAARAREQGSGDGRRLVAGPDGDGGLPLDGIAAEGLYLLLRANAPIGFATGLVRYEGGLPLELARVLADGLGTADSARQTGRYSIPVPAGAARPVKAYHPSTDELATAQADVGAGQVVALDLQVRRVPPTIVQLTPADNAVNVAPNVAIAITFSEPLSAAASLQEGTLQVELAGADGSGSGVFAAGVLSLTASGETLQFVPLRPLLPGRRFIARFSGGVADREGTPYSGPARSWSFATGAAVLPGSIDPTRFHVRIPENGVAAVFADPGALPGTGDWSVSPYVVGPWPGRDPIRDSFGVNVNGSFQGTAGRPEYPVTIESEIWVQVIGPSDQVEAEFRIGPLTSADGKGFVAAPGEALTFRSAEGVLVEVPAGAFERATLVRIELLDPSRVGAALPPGMAIGAYVNVDFDGRAKETLRVSVPAPAAAPDDADVFIGQVKNLPWGKRLQLISYGGVLHQGGERFLSNDPSLQAEPDRAALAGGLAIVGGEQRVGMGGMEAAPQADLGEIPKTCKEVKQRGLGNCFARDLLMEFELRSLAVFAYGNGVGFAMISGGAAFLPWAMGVAQEAFINRVADQWVYLPRPIDSVGGFWMLPIAVDSPFVIQRRDAATGWVISERAYDPVPPGGPAVMTVDPVGGLPPRRPMLIGAKPFQLLRFGAPPEDEKTRLRLEVELATDLNNMASLRSVEDFPLPEHSTIGIWDLSPLSPPDPEEPPQQPVRGPKAQLCGDPSFDLAMEATAEMMAVIMRGDLEQAELETFEFLFDRGLADLSLVDEDQLVLLRDLGPYDGCSLAGGGEYPKRLAVHVDQEENGQRLLVSPLDTLPMGHRFELELLTGNLQSANDFGLASGLSYWTSAPTLFEFATRKVPGKPVGSVDPSQFPFAGSATARDLVKLGNLMIVASDSGKVVAVDTNGVTAEERLTPYALLNAVSGNHRNLATDGHNRVFYTGLFGSTWAIKTIRLEDVRGASMAQCHPDPDAPDWEKNLPCFDPVEGSVRLSYMLGSQQISTPSEYVASGTFPSGNPSDLDVLIQDEIGKTFEAETFHRRYRGVGLDGLIPDAEGIYTFDLPLTSSYKRAQSGQQEASQPYGTPPPPAELRAQSCLPAEPKYDRFQRVTVDNLTTGQSWSIDLENPWPVDGGGGSGQGTVEKVKARKGDLLRVRYNLRSLGYVSLAGAGIQVIDLNRFYRLLQPRQTPGGTQCGRRLGRFEGATVDFPSCASQFGAEPDGISLTPSLAVHAETGCGEDGCRGSGRIDVYSPLQYIGGIHSGSTNEDPGTLYFMEMAACLRTVDSKPVFLRDLALANDAAWVDRGVTGNLAGVFAEPPGDFEPRLYKGDLAFLSLGVAGIYVFDVTDRELSEGTLIGLLQVPGHTAFRLQVDPLRGLLFAGGNDTSRPGSPPVIDVWDLRNVNGGPGTKIRPQPRVSVDAPWRTNHIGIDTTGTGLIYTWDDLQGPLAVPVDRAEFKFSGLYLPEEGLYEDDGNARKPSVQRITSRFVPLGVPMETKLDRELDAEQLKENERKGTAAFKVRLSLPGDFGERLVAKVQSLRGLPDERNLGKEQIGAMPALPGGEGWPETEQVVTLRRVGLGQDEPAGGSDPGGEAGRFGTAYNLYESEETILLLADPRARREYRRQDLPDAVDGGKKFDEKAQCRRCDYPSYLPDPELLGPNAPELQKTLELLAGGRYLRAFLFVDPDADADARAFTEAALAYFELQKENYPLPAGWAAVVAPADAVPSPLQVSLAEPAQNAAFWSPGEAGVSVMLAGTDATVKTTDHQATGRGVPFSWERTYRSQMLGYGPLGAAGWSANLQAHLRENEGTGEVEYHDGHGQVWRFFPGGSDDEDKPDKDDYEDDSSGSYWAPKGVYLRLQKLSGDQGWRLLGRQHDVLQFDRQGRLAVLSDRLRQNAEPGEQGNSLELRYDAFGQLTELVDDLGRSYRFEYFEDPRPVAAGGDGKRYGLLKKIEDFVGRTVEYEWSEKRELVAVKLPEVKNPLGPPYDQYSYEGEDRPKLRYEYAPEAGVSADEMNPGAILHGKFAQLRLEAFYLPDFLDDGATAPRVYFRYDEATGRLASLSLPTPANTNGAGGGVRWSFDVETPTNGAGPVEAVDVVAPWGHRLEHSLQKGRVTRLRENIPVVQANGGSLHENVDQLYVYSPDGRLVSQTAGDGGQLVNCYPDGAGSEVYGGFEGCPAGEPTPAGADGPQVDRLMLANVGRQIRRATTPDGKGSADYTQIAEGAEYSADNLMAAMNDGMGRPIGIPVGQADGESMATFNTEGVGANFKYDAYGRVEELSGFGDGARLKTEFHDDRRGKRNAGLLRRVSPGSDAFWRELDYDEADNIKEERTSYGALTRYTYDNWDRAVRIESGLVDPAGGGSNFLPVGGSVCGGAQGAQEEKAYDAAGHVIRERRLQDYIRTDGVADCRWVETIYTYNAREQVVAVEQTHLASPLVPGEVMAGAVKTQEKVFDNHGRVEQEISLNQVDPPLVTTYRYDEASRVAGTRVGQAAETLAGYDRKHRLVRQTDGDLGVWTGRYDVWDRLYHEVAPTGLVTRNRFDRAGNPIHETQWNKDPTTNPDAVLLTESRMWFNSFGEVARTLEKQAADPAGPPQWLVTEQVFDPSGRTVGVFSGPALPNSEELDPDQARREEEYSYEIATGRVILALSGGAAGEPAPLATRYEYFADNRAPWPDRVATLEQVPGVVDLVETSAAAYSRDVFGRVVVETGNDGSQIATLHDRIGGPIQIRTGAGSTISTAFDSRGRTIRHFRPNSRGETRYAYDLDGRMLREQTTSESGAWETAHVYDATGRLVQTNHADGSSESWTYNPDNSVATTTNRDGVEIEYGWDEANRLISAVPTASPQRPSLAPLDAGDFFAYDILSRPTSVDRGGFQSPAVDPALAVAYPAYDMASRPGRELVGSRPPLTWTYDVWSRPVELGLPLGVGRGAGSFVGYQRRYDTFDRLAEVASLGGEPAAAPFGATWGWGGGHLYSIATKTANRTTQRLGYIDGAGPQAPGFVSGDPSSRWRLGTITWGADPGGSPIVAAPAQVWGQLAFGWRGNDGTPQDGVKIGRLAVAGGPGLDLFAGMGWTWNYDAGVRLAHATSGRGDLQGIPPPGSDESFRYEYGKGDELERIVRESEGRISKLEVGPHGRISHRDSVPFAYDPSGRRTEDDRFAYVWNWRGELVSVTVKSGWTTDAGQASPFAGHQVRYEYDALGRLTYRWHLGPLPAGALDDSLRPFIEKRAYLWEGDFLLAEVGYGDAAETQVRWRKTYLPGSSGYDDAVQVMVDNVAAPGGPYGGQRLYTYLRDEQGTVIGVVAEQEAGAAPVVPVRYFYTPYGEAHAELGPELRQVKSEAGVFELSGAVQPEASPAIARGALRLVFTLPLAPASLAGGLSLEKLTGSGWSALGPAELTVSADPLEPADLLLLPNAGWQRGASYRLQIGNGIRDRQDRQLIGAGHSFELQIPQQNQLALAFEQKVELSFESFEAAGGLLAGRFPGGQSSLFQGLWTDPVVGIAYARARWYDGRNAAWLSEDPLTDIDSPNRYAFVGWQPQMGSDPSGQIVNHVVGGLVSVAIGYGASKLCESMAEDEDAKKKCKYSMTDAAIDFGVGFATSGLSAVAKIRTLGKLGTAAVKIGGEIALDTAGEVIRREAKGEDYSLDELALGAAKNWALGEAGARVGSKVFGKLGKNADPAKIEKQIAASSNKSASSAMRRSADDVAEGASEALSRNEDEMFQGLTCPVNCFSGDTLVATLTGLRPIQEIAVGDLVWSQNFATGQEELAKVVGLFRNEVDQLRILTAGDELISTTGEHPFFVQGRGWVEARLLRAGDVLLGEEGALIRLDAVAWEEVATTVYNFEVEGLHNYFVGEEEILVHNCRKPVQALEVDDYAGLKAGAVKGDKMDHHEIPSNAAIRKAKELLLGRSLTKSERRALQKTNTSVEIPHDLHLLQVTTGGKNTKAQILADAADLSKAAKRDIRVFVKTAIAAGFDPKEVSAAARKIYQMNLARGIIRRGK
jgi:RHS repeat-associated protein